MYEDSRSINGSVLTQRSRRSSHKSERRGSLPIPDPVCEIKQQNYHKSSKDISNAFIFCIKLMDAHLKNNGKGLSTAEGGRGHVTT